MFTTLGYLYNQIHTVVDGKDPSNRWYLMYYAKTVKLHKGIDNPLKFRIKNNNQKDVDISGSTFWFYMIDSYTKHEVLAKEMTIEDATKGIVNLIITEENLLDLNALRYNYGIKVTDSAGNERPLFVDDNYSASGVVEVFDDAYPAVINSIELLPSVYTNNIATTSLVEVNLPSSNQQTATYYLENFTGTITVQGHMEDTANVQESSWINITSNFYTTTSGIAYVNFIGLFNGIRFKIEKTDGTVNKILYKN